MGIKKNLDLAAMTLPKSQDGLQFQFASLSANFIKFSPWPPNAKHYTLPSGRYLKRSYIAAIAGFSALLLSQQISQDPKTGSLPIEVVHLYINEYPQGSHPFYRLYAFTPSKVA